MVYDCIYFFLHGILELNVLNYMTCFNFTRDIQDLITVYQFETSKRVSKESQH